MKVLGIESSCDETAAAIVEDGRNIISSVVASQVEIHARYGGVVPEVASRQHMLSIIPVIDKTLEDTGIDWKDIDGIAVTFGPGLAGALLVGMNVAKTISAARNIPFIGVNHLEAHIYANWLDSDQRTMPAEEDLFPCICLIISGGHSDLVLMKGHGQFERVGRTRDDAAGEAFDKAARILGLGYPGGPAIEKAATQGKPSFQLPRAQLKNNYDFSFSGVKTALWHLVHRENIVPNDSRIADIAASFQNAIVDSVVKKTVKAAEDMGVQHILVSGGVSANRALRNALKQASPVAVHIPPIRLCTDNAAMIASCGYFHLVAGEKSSIDLDIIPSLSFLDKTAIS